MRSSCSQRLGPEARIVAGGHSLLPMMKLRLAAPEYLVDINELESELCLHPRGGRRGPDRRADPPPRPARVRAARAQRLPIFRDAERGDRRPARCATAARSAARCARPTRPRTCPSVCAALDARRPSSAGRERRARGRHGRLPPRARTRPRSADGEMLVEVRVPLRARRRQRLREGRARARATGRSPPPARRCWIDGAHDRPTPGIAPDRGRRARVRAPRAPRTRCAASRRPRRLFAAAARLAAEDCDADRRPARLGGLQAPPGARAHPPRPAPRRRARARDEEA